MNLLRRGTRASSRAGEGGRLDTRLGEELGTRSRCRDISGGVRMESLEARGREACVRPRPSLPPLPPENIPGVFTLLPKQSTHPKKIPEFASSHPEETDLCLVPGARGGPRGVFGASQPLSSLRRLLLASPEGWRSGTSLISPPPLPVAFPENHGRGSRAPTGWR